MGISPARFILPFPFVSDKLKCFSIPNQDKVQWYIAVSQIQRFCLKIHFSSRFSSRPCVLQQLSSRDRTLPCRPG